MTSIVDGVMAENLVALESVFRVQTQPDTGKYSLGQQTNLTILCKERLKELVTRALFVDLGSILVSHFPDSQQQGDCDSNSITRR